MLGSAEGYDSGLSSGVDRKGKEWQDRSFVDVETRDTMGKAPSSSVPQRMKPSASEPAQAPTKSYSQPLSQTQSQTYSQTQLQSKSQPLSQSQSQPQTQNQNWEDLLPPIPTSSVWKTDPSIAYVREDEKVPSKKDLENFGWEEVTAPDGRLYYYHKITRISRWDRPDFAVMEAVDTRLKESQNQIDEALERRRAEREVIKKKEADKQMVSEQLRQEMKTTIQKWRTRPRGQLADIVEMLNTLDGVLPECVSKGQVVVKTAPPISSSDVKKGYMKAVRLIHPDKLSSDLDLRTKILAESVFICLTENYDAYKAAHGN